MSDDREGLRREAARWVRQCLEVGQAEWFLDRAGRSDVLRVVAASTASVAASAAAPAEPPAGAGRAVARETGAVRTPGNAGPATPYEGAPSFGLWREALSAGAGKKVPAESGETSGPARSGGTRPAPGSDAVLALPDDHEALRAVAMACTRCGLAETRTQVVFCDGVRDARLMVVGEAPGANEDETGLPFVGAAGKFLDLLLATVDLSREESVYICNVLKCRPPGNRNPEPAEIRACSPFLRKQIEIVRPEAILAVGSFAAQLLTGQEKAALGQLRGQVHGYEGVPLVVTYHPAALLRNGTWTRAFWDDLQLLRDIMDGSHPGGRPVG